MTFNDTDKYCLHCGQITERARGVNKQNLKKLFFSKPTFQECIQLFMIIMVLLIAWRYYVEIGMCREIAENPAEVCAIWSRNMLIKNSDNTPNFESEVINLTGTTLNSIQNEITK